MTIRVTLQIRKLKKSYKRVEKARKRKITARSKRVAVQRGIPSKRKFDNAVFQIYDWKTVKSDADRLAREIREDDYNVRIVSQKSREGRKGWAVYIRRK